MEKKTFFWETTDRISDFTPKSAEKVLSGKNKHPLTKAILFSNHKQYRGTRNEKEAHLTENVNIFV